MKNWFEVKVKFNKTGEDGKEQKVSEVYLFDAVSFTEAEARTFKEIQEASEVEEIVVDNIKMTKSKDFVVDAIKKSKIVEVFAYDSGEYWFRIVVEMIIFNEGAKKEQKEKENYLILADDIEQALTRINKSLDSSVVPYVINSVSISNIIDIFKHIESEEK